jgi:hypothetical protein
MKECKLIRDLIMALNGCADSTEIDNICESIRRTKDSEIIKEMNHVLDCI